MGVCEDHVSQTGHSIPNGRNMLQQMLVMPCPLRVGDGAAHRDMQLTPEPLGRPAAPGNAVPLGVVSEGEVAQRRHAANLHALVARVLQRIQKLAG